ncbi:putative phosphoesterase [Herbihabitans rhizosphaerae]|uniref:Putative phosphoesterase n=1 Tax=Herbihabitans rhizosphaerae TaxID=1872711 RepID=A0A4Q7KHD7_9PSEU|nr:metallophosphoesterase family protein [Herbihabitans rhizosphaerae]RZS34320.1 putative phosphoesterase [Herbihabitans rhizosphaerae]
MFESVAVLSDIHGVLPALDAVLAEPDVAAADVVVLPGDIALGPQPAQVVDRLLELGDRARWVHGNCERELLALAHGEAIEEEPSPLARWAAAQLRPHHIEALDSLPHNEILDVHGLGDVLFCHATPRDDEEFALVDSSYERWSAVLAGVPKYVRTIVCGHTHMPYLRLVDRRTVVNPGSVGMPYGNTGAHWALLGGATGAAIQLRRTDYDIETACAEIVATSGFPGVDSWVDEFVRTSYSDVEAHGVFAPKDGRGLSNVTDG